MGTGVRIVTSPPLPPAPGSVIIDCTASDEVADHYETWMKMGIHIVTPNKKLNSGDLGRYKRVKELGREMYTHYFSEASVRRGCVATPMI